MLARSSKVHVLIWCGVARGCKVWLGVGFLVYSGHSRCPGSDYRVQHPGSVSDWLTSYQRVKSPSLSPKIQDWRWLHGPSLWETQRFGWLKNEREKTTRKKHFRSFIFGSHVLRPSWYALLIVLLHLKVS